MGDRELGHGHGDDDDSHIQSAHAIRKSGAKRIIVYYYAIY